MPQSSVHEEISDTENEMEEMVGSHQPQLARSLPDVFDVDSFDHDILPAHRPLPAAPVHTPLAFPKTPALVPAPLGTPETPLALTLDQAIGTVPNDVLQNGFESLAGRPAPVEADLMVVGSTFAEDMPDAIEVQTPSGSTVGMFTLDSVQSLPRRSPSAQAPDGVVEVHSSRSPSVHVTVEGEQDEGGEIFLVEPTPEPDTLGDQQTPFTHEFGQWLRPGDMPQESAGEGIPPLLEDLRFVETTSTPPPESSLAVSTPGAQLVLDMRSMIDEEKERNDDKLSYPGLSLNEGSSAQQGAPDALLVDDYAATSVDLDDTFPESISAQQVAAELIPGDEEDELEDFDTSVDRNTTSPESISARETAADELPRSEDEDELEYLSDEADAAITHHAQNLQSPSSPLMVDDDDDPNASTPLVGLQEELASTTPVQEDLSTTPILEEPAEHLSTADKDGRSPSPSSNIVGAITSQYPAVQQLPAMGEDMRSVSPSLNLAEDIISSSVVPINPEEFTVRYLPEVEQDRRSITPPSDLAGAAIPPSVDAIMVEPTSSHPRTGERDGRSVSPPLDLVEAGIPPFLDATTVQHQHISVTPPSVVETVAPNYLEDFASRISSEDEGAESEAEDADEDQLSETDAEGDDDPEYVPSSRPASHPLDLETENEVTSVDVPTPESLVHTVQDNSQGIPDDDSLFDGSDSEGGSHPPPPEPTNEQIEYFVVATQQQERKEETEVEMDDVDSDASTPRSEEQQQPMQTEVPEEDKEVFTQEPFPHRSPSVVEATSTLPIEEPLFEIPGLTAGDRTLTFEEDAPPHGPVSPGNGPLGGDTDAAVASFNDEVSTKDTLLVNGSGSVEESGESAVASRSDPAIAQAIETFRYACHLFFFHPCSQMLPP